MPVSVYNQCVMTLSRVVDGPLFLLFFSLLATLAGQRPTKRYRCNGMLQDDHGLELRLAPHNPPGETPPDLDLRFMQIVSKNLNQHVLIGDIPLNDADCLAQLYTVVDYFTGPSGEVEEVTVAVEQPDLVAISWRLRRSKWNNEC